MKQKIEPISGHKQTMLYSFETEIDAQACNASSQLCRAIWSHFKPFGAI